MGKYMTHEQLPFKGKLVKIRLRTYGFNSIVTQPRNEEELLEITPGGTVKLTTTRVDGRQKRKVQIPVEDAEYIFNAFIAVFSEYNKMKIPTNSGFWRVRLLTDENEVFFYHGSNGQDFVYEGKTLTEILRERTTLKELNGFAMSIDKESHVSSIDIDFHQTVTEDAAEKVAEKYHAPVEDIVERLIISSKTHEIAYNRRVGNNRRVSLTFEMPEAVKDLLNQVYVRRESEKDIRDILAMFEAVFSAYEPTGFVCDAGSWELVLTNDKKERFHYEGTLCMDFSWQGESVSDCLRSILDWSDLWAFAPALEEEADAGSETDDEDTLMWHASAVQGKDKP